MKTSRRKFQKIETEKDNTKGLGINLKKIREERGKEKREKRENQNRMKKENQESTAGKKKIESDEKIGKRK
ncbi:hypothetical protein LEP1GSC052_2188 [Leptospira kmetyi serovar Malaysia str. Bejo-Iso9]|nr:hypothetical protein LEP1GSC052_2188 [Leptospira kmetyi serovar Malaysia str. Bejo-Iso9]